MDRITENPRFNEVVEEICAATSAEEGGLPEDFEARITEAVQESGELPNEEECEILAVGQEQPNGDHLVPAWIREKYPALSDAISSYY
jgi:hypothetical protein